MSTTHPKRHLKCSCCGEYAGLWVQFNNQDTGYGLCPKCRDWIWDRNNQCCTNLEFTSTFGRPGVNYEAWPDGHPAKATIYVVMRNHSLGYISEAPGFVGVLASDVDGFDPKNGSVSFYQCEPIRRATPSDFERFRVSLPPDFTT